MDKPIKSLDANNKKKSLLPKKSLLEWEPDEELKKVIAKSLGLEKQNEHARDA
jgi:hypothetical protein